MPALFAALAFLLAQLMGATAAGLDPDRAEREARSELRSVLRKQRTDDDVPPSRQAAPIRSTDQTQPRSATTGPTRKASGGAGPTKSGIDLPSICIGCGAK